MKEDNYTEIICRRFCRYYKEGKEELTCGTYNFLARTLTLNELMNKSRAAMAEPDFSADKEILKAVCEECDFFRDGCDFRGGIKAPPCGGYTIVEWLLKKGQAAGNNRPSEE